MPNRKVVDVRSGAVGLVLCCEILAADVRARAGIAAVVSHQLRHTALEIAASRRALEPRLDPRPCLAPRLATAAVAANMERGRLEIRVVAPRQVEAVNRKGRC